MFPEAFEEEWINVTPQIKWQIVDAGNSSYYLIGLYEGNQVVYWYASEGIKGEKRPGFKLETTSNVFRVMKKSGK